MLRGIWGDPERYIDTYWSRFEGMYFAGDGAKLDDDGAIWLLGRVDDVMLVSGHNISTTEVESALVSHPAVADVVVAGRPSERWGQEVVAVVALAEGAKASEEDLIAHAGESLARYKLPKAIVFRTVIERSPSGKADYRWAREQATAGSTG